MWTFLEPDRPRTIRIYNEMDLKEFGQSLRYTFCIVENNWRTCLQHACSFSRHWYVYFRILVIINVLL